MSIHSINAAFDSGNIDVVSITDNTATLPNRRDREPEFVQLFHFPVLAAARE